jgi:CRISPR type II-A-associated protein Csn2
VNINILGYDNKIEFEDGCINVLEIADKHTFTSYVSLFNELCNNEKLETTEITLHMDSGLGNFSVEAEIVIDIFNVELNSKKIVTKLYKRIEENLEESDVIEVNKLVQSLRNIMYSKAEELPFNFEIEEDINPQELLKMFNVKIDTNMYTEFIEKLTYLVDIISTLKIAQIIILPNLKSYLQEDELVEFYKYVLYKDVKLLIIENNISEKKLKYEKIMRIDETFCDMIL